MNRIFLLLTVAIIALTSCKKQADKGPNELKIGVMSSMDFVPLAVAREMGFFDKHQVKVNIQKFYSANDRDAAFQSGNIDGTVIDYTGAIMQKAGGVDLKLTSACNATFCIMVGPNSSIQQLADLKNKKVAVSRNTVIDFCVETALHSVNLRPSDVEKQEINKIPIRLEMLMNGQTEVTALPDPFITIASSKGAHSIACMQDLGYVVTGFAFKTQSIETKSKELTAFYAAYNDAVEYIKAHTVEDLKSILVQDIGFPEPLVSSVNLPVYTSAQMPKNRDIQAAINWLKQKSLIPAGFTTDDLFDDRFIDK